MRKTTSFALLSPLTPRPCYPPSLPLLSLPLHLSPWKTNTTPMLYPMLSAGMTDENNSKLFSVRSSPLCSLVFSFLVPLRSHRSRRSWALWAAEWVSSLAFLSLLQRAPTSGDGDGTQYYFLACRPWFVLLVSSVRVWTMEMLECFLFFIYFLVYMCGQKGTKSSPTG